jgi:ribosomal protein L21E
MFKRGDRVTVASDNYAEPGQSFTGTTGEVTGTDHRNKIVVIRPDGETRSLGFGAEELKHTS